MDRGIQLRVPRFWRRDEGLVEFLSGRLAIGDGLLSLRGLGVVVLRVSFVADRARFLVLVIVQTVAGDGCFAQARMPASPSSISG